VCAEYVGLREVQLELTGDN